MKKKEFSIGEEFQCGLVKLECVKATNDCEDCVFFDNIDLPSPCSNVVLGECDGVRREDKTDVIFVKVED